MRNYASQIFEGPPLAKS